MSKLENIKQQIETFSATADSTLLSIVTKLAALRSIEGEIREIKRDLMRKEDLLREPEALELAVVALMASPCTCKMTKQNVIQKMCARCKALTSEKLQPVVKKIIAAKERLK